MITIGEIYDKIDAVAPFDTQMDFDNAGLLIGAADDPVYKALVALDVTNEVAEEAADKGCSLIVSHHPVIFHPLRRIAPGDTVYKLIERKIGVISVHTNYDVAEGGVNTSLAQAVGLTNARPFKDYRAEYGVKLIVFVPRGQADAVLAAMTGAGAGALGQYCDCAFRSDGVGQFRPLADARPAVGETGELSRVEETRLELLCSKTALPAVLNAMRDAHPYEEPAYDVLENRAVHTALGEGRVGELPEALPPSELARHIKRSLGCAAVRFAPGRHPVKRLAVCGGAGGHLVSEAARVADALLTGEVKHHEWLAAREMGLTLLDAGHFATEHVAMEPLRQMLCEAFPGLPVLLSEAHRDPVSVI